MKWSIYGFVLQFLFLGSAVHADEKEKKADPPSYTKDVKPFLAKYCVECHNGRLSRSGYNLDGFEALMKGSRKGPAVVVNEPDKSMIVRALGGKGKKMPPGKYKNQPKAEEVNVLKAWIAAGAKDDTEKGSVALPPLEWRALVRAALEPFSLRDPERVTAPFHEH